MAEPFNPANLVPDEAPTPATTGGFDPFDPSNLVADDAPDNVVLHEETGKMVSVPAGVSGDEAQYLAKTQVQGEPKSNFWGTVHTGIAKIGELEADLAMATVGRIPGAAKLGEFESFVGQGLGDFAIRTAPELVGGLTQEFGERNRDNSKAGGNPASLTNLFTPISTDPNSAVSQTKTAAFQRIADIGKQLTAKGDEWVKAAGLQAPKDMTTTQTFARDLGQGLGSVALSIGSSVMAGNPAIAAAVFGLIQKSDKYRQAREKGFSADEAGQMSTVQGVVNGAMEGVGNAYFLKIGEAVPGIKNFVGKYVSEAVSNKVAGAAGSRVGKIALAAGEEGLQEGSQQAAEEGLNNYSGLENTTVGQSLRNVGYAALLGAISGAPVAAIVHSAETAGQTHGVDPETSRKIGEAIAANAEEGATITAGGLQQGLSGITQDPEAQKQSAEVLKNFADHKPVSPDVADYISRTPIRYMAEDSELDAMTIGGRMTFAEGSMEPIDAGALPVTDTSRADALRDRAAEPVVTRKQVMDGRLRLLDSQVNDLDTQVDAQLALMAERDSAGKPNVANQNKLDRLLKQRDYLDSQRGDLLTRNESEGAEDLYRENLIMRGRDVNKLAQQVVSERSRALEAGLREGRRMALTDVGASQNFMVNLLDESGLTPADKAKFIKAVKNVKTPEDAERQLPIIQSRISRLLELQAQRETKAKLKTLLDKTKLRKQSGKPVGKYTAELQEVFDTLRAAVKMKAGQAADMLNTRLANESYTPSPYEALENAVLSIVSDAHEVHSSDMASTLESVQELVGEGKAAGIERLVARAQRVDQLKRMALQAVTGNVRTEDGDLQARIQREVIGAGRSADEAINGAMLYRSFLQTTVDKRLMGLEDLQQMVTNAFRRLSVQEGTETDGTENTLFQRAAPENTKAFRNWFDGSKMVTREGEPMVLYHGTADDVDAYDLDHPNRKDTGWLGEGVYLTNEPIIANEYANRKKISGAAGPNVMPLYASIKNPFVIDGIEAGQEMKDRLRRGGREYSQQYVASLKRKGYDGLVWNTEMGVQEILAFDPGQVKSPFNSGAWNREDARILKQDAKGSITLDPNESVIRLFQSADASTFLHETGHFFWDVMEQIAAHPSAPQDIVADVNTVRAWAGAEDGQPMTVEQLEEVARGFEAYLREGNAPTPELRAAFERFKQWLMEIYRALRDLNVEITPEVRSVFDRYFDGATPLPEAFNRDLVDRTSAGYRAAQLGRDTRAGSYRVQNSWHDYMNKIFGGDKTGAGQELIETLGNEVSDLFQKRKGVARVAMERFSKTGMEAFGFTKEKQLVNQLSEDSKLVDLGTFQNSAGKEVKFQLSKAEARKRWMELQDTTLYETITSPGANAYTPQMMDALDSFLTPEDKKFAQAQLDFYRWFYPQINQVYSRVFGVNLPSNPNYSPISREHFSVTEPMFLKDVQYRNSVSPGSLKSRVATLAELKNMPDFMTLQSHIAEMSHFMVFAEKTQELDAVFGDKAVQRAIKDKYSDITNEDIKGYLQDFRAGQIKILKDGLQAIEKLRQNFSVAVLGAKPALAIKNFTSFLNYAEFIPAADYAVGLADFMRHPVEVAKILGQSEQFKARSHNLDRDIALAYQSAEFGKFRKVQSLRNSMLWFTQAGDSAAILYGGWPVYRYHKNVLGKTHEEALREFDRATAMSRQSSDLDQMSRLQASPTTASRFITQLMSDQNQMFRREMRAILDGWRGTITPGDAAKRVFLYHFLIPMFYQFVADLGFDKENQIRAGLLGSLNGAFILADILTATVNTILGERVFAKTNTAFEFIGDMMQGITKLNDEDATAEDFVDGTLKLLTGVGELAGFPLGRVTDVVEGTENLQDDETKAGVARYLGFPKSVANRAAEEANDAGDDPEAY